MDQQDKPIDQELSEALKRILTLATLYNSTAISSNEVNFSQRNVNRLKDILKHLSQLERKVATLVKQAKIHVTALRQANPVGKPEEGQKRIIGDKSYVFLSNAWYRVIDEPAKEKTP